MWRPTPNRAAGRTRDYSCADAALANSTSRFPYRIGLLLRWIRVGTDMNPVEALHRKLQRLGAVLKDPSVTEHERVNAEALKTRLEDRLTKAGAPKGDWTDILFRLGRTVQEMKKTTAPPPSSSGAAKIAFRLGRTLREGLKKWRSP